MKLGIIGAMDVEVATLKEKMEQVTTKTVAGTVYFDGRLAGLPAVVVQCGVGKVNAALCAQILCDCFGVTHIVNTGIAGSLDAKLDIGDLVISQDVIYHDFDLRFWGRPIGQVPGMDVTAFPADEALRTAALKAAEEGRPSHSTVGRIASGDQFICDKQVKEKIIENTGAICTEMEGAAIAQVAFVNDTPFAVIRAISDNADGNSSVSFPTFLAAAVKTSQKLTEALIEAY